jgi:hypothetical protein
MKNSTKLFLVLLIITGFGVRAYAQQSDNAVTDAKAEVSALVNVTELQDLIFGVVTPGVTKTIDTDGTVIAGTAGTGATIGAEFAGKFSITKGTNTSVTLAFTLPSNLVNTVPDPDENLAINFVDAGGVKLAQLAAFNGGQADLLFTPADGITTANSGATAEYYADDDFYVYIGGTVVPTVDQESGVYEGTITLSATYN